MATKRAKSLELCSKRRVRLCKNMGGGAYAAMLHDVIACNKSHGSRLLSILDQRMASHERKTLLIVRHQLVAMRVQIDN
jgi:hypothetical protein